MPFPMSRHAAVRDHALRIWEHGFGFAPYAASFGAVDSPVDVVDGIIAIAAHFVAGCSTDSDNRVAVRAVVACGAHRTLWAAKSLRALDEAAVDDRPVA